MNRPPPRTDVPGAGFVELRERAIRLLATAERPVSDTDLAGTLFGTTTGGRWALLLATVLGEDARFCRESGGWRLSDGAVNRAAELPWPPSPLARDEGLAPPEIPAPPAPQPGVRGVPPAEAPGLAAATEIVALAIATTGADPDRHRIVRVAVVRRAADVTLARLDQPVRPARRLPRYLAEAARLAADDLDQAPGFAEIVPALREIVGRCDVHAYGATWTEAFLRMELARAGLSWPDLHLVEIDALAQVVLPPDVKPGLVSTAAALGLAHPRPGFPLTDAEVAVRVVAELRATTSDPEAGADVPDRAEATRALGGWGRALPFSRTWLQSVPAEPGVYAIEDAAGRALYVGKATDLHRRLLAYLGRAPALHRRLEALAVRAQSVTILPTPSDLEATLLEARLIQAARPVFNVARATREARTIVRAAPHEPRPRVHLVGEVCPDGARYFGPFRSVKAAQRVLSVARQAYPDAFARRTDDPERQRAAVLAACRLLGGQKAAVVAELRARMAASAASGDAATVAELWRILKAVQDLEIQPSPLAGLPPDRAILIVETRAAREPRAHLLHDGRYVGSADVDTSIDLRDAHDAAALAAEIEAMAAGGPSPHDDLDALTAATIVRRWLALAAATVQIVRVPPAAK